MIEIRDYSKSNQKAYESPSVIARYAHDDGLQAPERLFLQAYCKELPNLRMLDIGVGAGRTTLHFVGLVKEYVGVDYSANMIALSQSRFKDRANHATFHTCDVRSMSLFTDETFDFALF